jgi:hypothetical protein
MLCDSIASLEATNSAYPMETRNHASPSTASSPISDDCWKDLRVLRKNHPKNLIIGFININSIRNKYLCLKDIFDCSLVDFFSVLETKLDDSFPESQFTPEGFKVTRSDCRSNSGGIMCFIRSDIPHSRKELVEVNNDGLHSVCIEIIINK